MSNLQISLDDEQSAHLHEIAERLGVSIEDVVQKSVEEFCSRLQTEELEVRAMYPHMAKVFGPAGWDDPEMDDYNELDPRRQP